jgi:hypothetical protein
VSAPAPPPSAGDSHAARPVCDGRSVCKLATNDAAGASSATTHPLGIRTGSVVRRVSVAAFGTKEERVIVRPRSPLDDTEWVACRLPSDQAAVVTLAPTEALIGRARELELLGGLIRELIGGASDAADPRLPCDGRSTRRPEGRRAGPRPGPERPHERAPAFRSGVRRLRCVGDGGATWRRLRVAATPTRAFESNIAVAPDGLVGVLWLQGAPGAGGAAGATDVVAHLASSRNRGATWSSLTLAGPFRPAEGVNLNEGGSVGEYQGITGLPGGLGVALTTVSRASTSRGATVVHYVRVVG